MWYSVREVSKFVIAQKMWETTKDASLNLVVKVEIKGAATWINEQL